MQQSYIVLFVLKYQKVEQRRITRAVKNHDQHNIFFYPVIFLL